MLISIENSHKSNFKGLQEKTYLQQIPMLKEMLTIITYRISEIKFQKHVLREVLAIQMN